MTKPLMGRIDLNTARSIIVNSYLFPDCFLEGFDPVKQCPSIGYCICDPCYMENIYTAIVFNRSRIFFIYYPRYLQEIGVYIFSQIFLHSYTA